MSSAFFGLVAVGRWKFPYLEAMGDLSQITELEGRVDIGVIVPFEITLYTYDAAGNKLKTEITETGQLTKSIAYINGFVYENNVLQFIGHEEGRLRFETENNTLQYDYMLKDHLGNVRMVLTEEQKQDQYPAATM